MYSIQQRTLGPILRAALGLAVLVVLPSAALGQASYSGFGEITVAVDTPSTSTLTYTTSLPSFIQTLNTQGNASGTPFDFGSTTSTSVTAHAGVSGTASSPGHVDNSDATNGYASIEIENTGSSEVVVDGHYTFTNNLTASVTNPGIESSYVEGGAYIYLYDIASTTFYDGIVNVVYGQPGGNSTMNTVPQNFSLSVPANSSLFLLFYPFAFGAADATAVPEPGAMALLLGSGMGGGLFLRSRLRRK